MPSPWFLLSASQTFPCSSRFGDSNTVPAEKTPPNLSLDIRDTGEVRTECPTVEDFIPEGYTVSESTSVVLKIVVPSAMSYLRCVAKEVWVAQYRCPQSIVLHGKEAKKRSTVELEHPRKQFFVNVTPVWNRMQRQRKHIGTISPPLAVIRSPSLLRKGWRI